MQSVLTGNVKLDQKHLMLRVGMQLTPTKLTAATTDPSMSTFAKGSQYYSQKMQSRRTVMKNLQGMTVGEKMRQHTE